MSKINLSKTYLITHPSLSYLFDGDGRKINAHIKKENNGIYELYKELLIEASTIKQRDKTNLSYNG